MGTVYSPFLKKVQSHGVLASGQDLGQLEPTDASTEDGLPLPCKALS